MPLQPTKRTLMRATAGALLLLAAPLSMAQAWPARPIRLVVPFPPGGLIDNMARLVGNRLVQELGQPVVIDNKPGAGGNVGAAEVARAPADGYTLLMASPALTISPAIYKNLPYLPSQLAPVALLGRVPNVLLVNPASGIGKVQDLVGRAKAKPGQLNYASNGNGTSLHLSAELFKRRSETFITHVPYRGAAPAVQDLIGGRVPFALMDSASVQQHLLSGKLRGIGVASPARLKTMADLPTLAEQGLSGFEAYAWQGLVVPTGTPPETVAQLHRALQQALDTTMVKARFQTLALEALPGTPKQMADYARLERERWGRLIAANNIRLD